jgi:hypothetical protein
MDLAAAMAALSWFASMKGSATKRLSEFAQALLSVWLVRNALPTALAYLSSVNATSVGISRGGYLCWPVEWTKQHRRIRQRDEDPPIVAKNY